MERSLGRAVTGGDSHIDARHRASCTGLPLLAPRS
jgi:hypothetical protein